MLQSRAKITAIGAYVPETILTNDQLEKMVDTNDEWIMQRTGIKERRISKQDEYTSDISYKAVINLMQRYNKAVDDVDMIIVCTLSPDYKTPSVASIVQAKLGIKHTGAMDLNVACAGFTYGLYVANGLVTAGLNKKVLVIGAETLSKVTDYTDRTTCILFGDGGGACLVEYDEQQPSFIASHLGSEGEGGKNLYSTSISKTMDGVDLVGNGCIVQNGREVYKWAVTTVPKGIKAVLGKTILKLGDINWFVPHSANLRMLESICERSGIPLANTLYSLVEYGNTSAASIPLALDKGVREGKVKNGDTLLLYGFGGGLAHSGLLLKWRI